jgi:S1-C subfamily serine protease
VSEESAAGAAGIKEGDRLVAIDEQPITSYAALRMAMLERRPGETVNVRYERKPLFGGPTEKTIGVVLR